MSEMVERVAQAICGDDNPENICAIHRSRARAAIEAMREPTAAMIEAAWKDRSYGDRGGRERNDFGQEYRYAIDEALK